MIIIIIIIIILYIVLYRGKTEVYRDQLILQLSY